MRTHRILGMIAIALLLVTPAWGQGTFFVEGDNVGIGIATPLVRLHIDNTGGDSNVVRLVRDGVLRYRLENTAVGVAWDFNNDPAGKFAISKVGTGQPELTLDGDGRLGVGCNAPDHDLVVGVGPGCTSTPRSWIDAGDTSFSISSSREIKENLNPVTIEGIVEKIEDIPVYQYDFIGGPDDRLGLMAEDFHRVFQRGSDKELSGHEVTMALWLAVQELATEVKALKASQGEGCAPRDGS